MNEYLKLAWRNIWRNKRRTLITAASVFFAIFFALIMRAFQLGSYGNMIDNVTKAYTGHIQIHANGFWEEKTIDNTFENTPELLLEIKNNENIDLINPRLESFALASSGEHTKGVLVLGINPEQENEMTELSKKVINGEFLKNGSDGAMVAEKLAKFLNLAVGDTVVLLGQGYHGVTAAGKYPVKAIVSFPAPDLNNSLIFIELDKAQYLYSATNRLTSYNISIKNNSPDELQITVNDLEKTLNTEQYEVMSWREISEILVQQIESDNASGLIMLGILYMIVTFGVFGTVLMMTAERRREFGVMIAVGMKKFKLAMIVTLEMIFIGLVGVISGIIASLPIIYYYHLNPILLSGEMAESIENMGFEPIMPMAWEPGFFINQSFVVIILIAVACIYPIYAITRLKVIKALRA